MHQLVVVVGGWPVQALQVLQVHRAAGTDNLHPFQQMELFSVVEVEETALERPLADYQFMAVLEEAVHRPELAELPRLQGRVVMTTFHRL